MDKFSLGDAINNGKIEWHKHALERMLSRGITRKAVIEIILTGHIIEEYPEQRPYPSALILGWSNREPFHVVVAFDETNSTCYIITTYRPDAEHFETDFKTRRRRE